eukprot:c12552_g1_i1.p1 GENE.c12552_g1_i1~~c12552_g1_i1.p1  ORF type:complete len:620 (-),score=99.48 c12552_g1_i1:97-1890(-)
MMVWVAIFVWLVGQGQAVLGSNAHSAGSHWTTTIPYTSPNLEVISITPNTGPVAGGTEVVVRGNGFRDFGRLVHCRFGSTIVTATFRTLIGDKFDPYNNHVLVCRAPLALSAAAVAVEVTLTLETFTNNSVMFSYYDPPTISSLSPSKGSTKDGTIVTVTGSGFTGSSVADSRVRYNRMCVFDGISATNLRTFVPATLLSNNSSSVLWCVAPAVAFVGSVTLSVALNGVDYENSGLFFDYKDNWYQPSVKGTPPSSRVFHTATYEPVSNRLIVFGGFDGSIRNDLNILYLDVSSSSSSSVNNMAWADASNPLLTQGSRPLGRVHHTSTLVDTKLFIYGGVPDYSAHTFPLASMYMLDTVKMFWNVVNDSSSPLRPSARAQHTATAIGKDIFVFGGRSLEACGYGSRTSRLCFITKRDAFYFNTDTYIWRGALASGSVETNSTSQVQPSARKGHSAIAVSKKIWIFGGETYSGTVTVLANDLYTFNTDFGVWSVIQVTNSPPARPAAREGHVAVLIQQRHMCVFGGRGVSGGALGDVWLLDTMLATWTRLDLPSTPIGRFGHVMATLDNSHILSWGGLSANGTLLQDLYIFNPFSDSE